MAHASWGLLKGNLRIGLGAASATGALGAALAVVYAVGGRSLAPCIVAHGTITAVLEPGLMLAALSGEMQPA